VVFNGIGDADLCGPGLAAAEAIVARSRRPVINRPSAVRATGRMSNAERLRGLPDVVVPRIAGVPRDRLLGPRAVVDLAGLPFPLLLRAPGFHTGRHFVRVADAQELAAAARELPGPDAWAIEPLDARGADGKFRKYRVMFIEGRLYPLHLAVSGHWKVHYFTAEMADVAAHRREDEAFLADMAGVIGARGMAALERIAAVLGLDYAGIDFGLGSMGEILFFEANAAMVVSPPTDDPKWGYRQAGVDRIIAAVRAMLRRRAGAEPRAKLVPDRHG
jgi:hypothetical protein